MPSFDRRQFIASSLATSLSTPVCYSVAAESLEQPPLLFRLGLVTYNIASKWDIVTIIKVCADIGIACVECRTTHKHGVEPSLSKDQRKEIKKRFADSGIVFWGCGSVCEFQSPEAGVVLKNIESCKSFIDLVHDLGGKGVKVRPNGLPKNVPVEKTLAQIGQSLKKCGEAAAHAGVEIWLEVHGPGTQMPTNIKTIMNECDHKSVGITWNSNPTDVENGSVLKSFNLLKSWIRSCHINDLENDARKKYPYRELFGLLRDLKYDAIN